MEKGSKIGGGRGTARKKQWSCTNLFLGDWQWNRSKNTSLLTVFTSHGKCHEY